MKKGIIAILTILMLSLCLCSISAGAEISEYRKTIKIGLFYGSGGKSEVTLSSETPLKIGYEENYCFVEEYDSQKTEITFVLNEENQIAEQNGETVFDPGKKLTVYSQTGIINVNGAGYRGCIMLLIGEGSITVVNLVDVDEYIKGVLGREMSYSWPLEALKAQAVCARNYALTTLNKHSSQGFDLCASTDCQAYSGISREGEAIIQAVEETKGVCLTYEGELVSTLFYSSNGGYTNESRYVWGTHVPYLIAKEDPYENAEDNPNYNWTVELTKEEIKENLSNMGVDLGDITDIEIVDATPSNQVLELKITGTTGEKIYKNDKARGAMGAGVLLSQRYTVSEKFATSFFAVTGKKETKESELSYALDGEKSVKQLPENIYVATSKGSIPLEKNVVAYIFNGNGWGHGLGMSQYGAKAMAEQGYTYDQILRFYYEGSITEGDTQIEDQ